MNNTIWMSFCLLFALFFCSRCEKRDIIARKPVKGMVFNNCTDSGLAGIKVYLQTFKDNSLENSQEVLSRSDGAFSFDAAEIHSSSKYSYAIHIPSKSGINGAGGNNVGFDGTTIYFSKDEAEIFMHPKVTPRFLILNLFLSKNQLTTHSDSILTMFIQTKFNRNRPDMPFSFGIGAYGDQLTTTSNIGSYPMGLYYVNSDVWANGNHLQKSDSLYLGWGDTKTYTINW